MVGGVGCFCVLVVVFCGFYFVKLINKYFFINRFFLSTTIIHVFPLLFPTFFLNVASLRIFTSFFIDSLVTLFTPLYVLSSFTVLSSSMSTSSSSLFSLHHGSLFFCVALFSHLLSIYHLIYFQQVAMLFPFSSLLSVPLPSYNQLPPATPSSSSSLSSSVSLA